MSLVKWEPFDDFDRMFREISSLPALKMSGMGFDLAADVYEDKGNVIAEMNLPGLKGDDIDIEVEDNHLRIAGKREESKEKKEKGHYSKEIRRGSFQRVIPLPQPVQQSKVKAEYNDGVLTITMPKKAEKAEKKVKVKVKK